jgi:hypothetical protein
MSIALEAKVQSLEKQIEELRRQFKADIEACIFAEEERATARLKAIFGDDIFSRKPANTKSAK